MTVRRAPAGLTLGALAWLAAVVAAVVYLVGTPGDDGDLQAPPLPQNACADLQLGVHSTLAYQTDPERRAAVLKAIEDDLAPQVVRDSLLWHRVEPVEGERDWSSPDGVVEGLREAGIEPLMIVLGSPPWANGVPESRSEDHYLYVPERGPELDAWLRDYSRFLAAAVERYQDVVRRWEVWNEANLEDFWYPRPDPLAYRQVYRTLRATILRVDPGAEVAPGGLASLSFAAPPNIAGRTFLRQFAGAGVPLDYVAIHPYTTNDHAPDRFFPGENNFVDIASVRNQIRDQGDPPIWVTEWGWPSDAVGEARQARYVDKSLRMIEARFPFVDVATYFVDHDRPPGFTHGLLTEDLEPKPAAEPFRRHAEWAAERCARATERREGR